MAYARPLARFSARRLRLVCTVGLIAATACDPGSDTEPEADFLAGRDFVLEGSKGHTFIDGVQVSLRFHDGEVTANAGCNTMFGDYRVRDGRLVIGERMWGSTEIGCESPYAEQDAWISEFLGGDPLFVGDDPRFEISNDEATLTFVDEEVAFPDLELVGPQWVLNGIIMGPGFGFGSWPQTVLQFSGDGSFSVAAGCPAASGRFSVDGARMTLSEVVSDPSACPDDVIGSFAGGFLRDGDYDFEVDNANLVMRRDDGGLSFIAERPAG